MQGPHLLKERDPTWQLSAAVRAGSSRSLCSWTDEEGTGTPGAMRDNFPWRQAPPPSRPGFMQRIVQNIVHRRLLRAVADENFMVSDLICITFSMMSCVPRQVEGVPARPTVALGKHPLMHASCPIGLFLYTNLKKSNACSRLLKADAPGSSFVVSIGCRGNISRFKTVDTVSELLTSSTDSRPCWDLVHNMSSQCYLDCSHQIFVASLVISIEDSS